jgi:hypothetical protein
MNKTKFVVWPALTPALSPGRGRIPRRVLNNRELSVIRALPSANYQPTAKDKLNVESPKMRDSCSLSLGERVRVRVSVPLTFLFVLNTRRRLCSCVIRQRMLRTFLERVEKHITNKLFLPPQLRIPKAKLLDAHRSQELGAFGVVGLLVGMPVLPTIKFNGETGFHAIEIEVVNPARVIAPKLVGAETTVSQPTPHEFFCPSLFLPQCAGAGCVGHGRSLKRRGIFRKKGFTTTLTPALSPRRGRNVRRRSTDRGVLDCSTLLAQITNLETGGAA